MDFQSEVQTLSRLGLTAIQAKVYLVVAKAGVADAKTISQKSGVARPDTYRIMRALEELGLVGKVLSLPSQFEAIPISDAVSMLIDKRNRETMEVQAKSIKLIAEFKNNAANEAFKQDAPQFVLIPKDEAGFKKRKSAFENAQESADVINSWKRHAHTVHHYAEIIEKAMARGVKIRVITEKPETNNASLETLQIFQNNPSHKVRYVLTALPGVTTIYDRKEVFLDVSIPNRYGDCPALWSNNPYLVAIIHGYFEAMWNRAIETTISKPSKLQNQKEKGEQTRETSPQS